MTDGYYLVMVASRSVIGIPCARDCGFNVELDVEAGQVLEMGGKLICQPCAAHLALRHPDAFIPVEGDEA